MALLVLITLRSISALFLKFLGNPESQDGIHDVRPLYMTSSLPVVDLKGNFFRRKVHPQSLIIITFTLAKLWKRKWGGGGGEGGR